MTEIQLKKKILDLIKEEVAKLAQPGGLIESTSIKIGSGRQRSSKALLQKEDKKRILDKYYRSIKLDRMVSVEEILDLEEESWGY